VTLQDGAIFVILEKMQSDHELEPIENSFSNETAETGPVGIVPVDVRSSAPSPGRAGGTAGIHSQIEDSLYF
jgi:hypothetical protein